MEAHPLGTHTYDMADQPLSELRVMDIVELPQAHLVEVDYVV
jgi:hypothetical protein